MPGIFERLFGRRSPTRTYELVPFQEDEGRGFYVRRQADGQWLRWETLPVRDGLESLPVVGVSRRLEVLQRPAFAAGRWLTLRREPENPHDPNAIAVWDQAGRAQVGYLPRERAKVLAKRMDADTSYRCLSTWETWDGKRRVALRVLLVAPGANLDTSAI